MMFQMFHSNRIKFLILIILFVVFSPKANAIVKPTSEFYVNDYANILSRSTEEYVLEKSVALNDASGIQFVVVTVPNLEGKSLEEYATTLFRNFGIGDKKDNKGLLLLLALEEREFRVEVGYGLEGILPDGKTGRFQDDYIIPYLKNNEWDNGVKNGYDAFFSEIVEQYNLNISYNSPQLVENDEYNVTSDDVAIVIIFLIFMIVIVLAVIFGKPTSTYYSTERTISFRNDSSSRSRYSGRGGSSGGGGSSRKF